MPGKDRTPPVGPAVPAASERIGDPAGTAGPTGEPLTIGRHSFSSRLIVGTGKYASYELMSRALDLSGTECITVAVRRERLIDAAGKNLLDFVDTSALHDPAQHGRVLHGRRRRPRGPAGPRNPHPIGQSRRRLGQAGSPRRHEDAPARSRGQPRGHAAPGGRGVPGARLHADDPVVARRLKEAGAASVMPAGSPIGSGQGVLNPNAIRICLEYLKHDDPGYPVIVDAGVGTASDVAVAMELGADGVLLNTGVAHAKDPLGMARAMRLATEAGRLAYLSGRIPKKLYATASSPVEGVVGR